LTNLQRLLFPCGFRSATRLAILRHSSRKTWPHHQNYCSLYWKIFLRPHVCSNCFISNSVNPWYLFRRP
jgi:hypothetical protein